MRGTRRERRDASPGRAARELSPTETILESISDGVFTVARDWTITSFNRAAERITGVPRAKALGRRCADVFRSSLCGPPCALAETLQNGKAIIGRSAYIINAAGERIPISLSTAVLRDGAGKVIGGAETFRDLSEVEALRRELDGNFRAGGMTSLSPLMQRVFALLPAIADSLSTALILGETGTGKEVLARAIHEEGPRRDGPFVAVNCGALPDNLLESELFGYKAGAFTGADRDKPGRFALARGGTLFLDEIGEVSPALQVSLLRVLQERRFEPLGSTRSERSDARIIAATNRDLAELVRKGTFREDLFYRINVVSIELPPLRRRIEDIPLLVDTFVNRFNLRQDRAVPGISAKALSLLQAYHWPGNIRELENVIERAFVLCRDGEIGLEHLPPELMPRLAVTPASDLRSARNLVEIQAIRAALEASGGNRTAAARLLGIHKTTFFRRVKSLGLALPVLDSDRKRDVSQ